MMVVWTRVLAVEVVKSGWILDLFKIRVECFVVEMALWSNRK